MDSPGRPPHPQPSGHGAATPLAHRHRGTSLPARSPQRGLPVLYSRPCPSSSPLAASHCPSWVKSTSQFCSYHVHSCMCAHMHTHTHTHRYPLSLRFPPQIPRSVPCPLKASLTCPYPQHPSCRASGFCIPTAHSTPAGPSGTHLPRQPPAQPASSLAG